MADNIVFVLVSCAAFMGLVGLYSWHKTRGQVSTKDGYFLAGRGLSGVFICGSLLLTNLSAEQLVGLNGSAYGHNLSSMAWEVTAAFAIMIMALVFLPRYLAGAFSTLPEFLRDRFDDDVRRMTVVLFLVGYALITIPSVLYSGGIAVLQLFDVPKLLGVSYEAALLATILTVGLVGSIYAIFGGLMAVAVSDTVNGIGLLIIGILVPILGFIALGNGDFFVGITEVASTHQEKLNAIGGADDPTPFGTLFTGMILANLFYWGTNQYVIQRVLGAKNLKEGQKGVILSGFFKIIVPFMMMIPGVIAFHLYGPGLASIDLAYPKLVNDLLPVWLSGFFLAVLLGAIFSSFNSLLNSAATLFVLDIYAPFKGGKVSDEQLIRVAKAASVIIAVASFVVAPLLQYFPEGLFQVIRKFTGFYNIPVIAIVLAGLFLRNVPSIGPKIAIGFHVIAYGIVTFAWVPDLHFIHIYAVLFTIEMGIMIAASKIAPRSEPYVFKPNPKVDMTPWRYSLPVSIILASSVVLVYVVFSPIGLAGDSQWFMPTIAGVLGITVLLVWLSLTRWHRLYASRIEAIAGAKA